MMSSSRKYQQDLYHVTIGEVHKIASQWEKTNEIAVRRSDVHSKIKMLMKHQMRDHAKLEECQMKTQIKQLKMDYDDNLRNFKEGQSFPFFGVDNNTCPRRCSPHEPLVPCDLAGLEEILAKLSIVLYKCENSRNKDDLKFLLIDVCRKQNWLENSVILEMFPVIEKEVVLEKIQIMIYKKNLDILKNQIDANVRRRQNHSQRMYAHADCKKLAGVRQFCKFLRRLKHFFVETNEDEDDMKDMVMFHRLVNKIGQLIDSTGFGTRSPLDLLRLFEQNWSP